MSGFRYLFSVDPSLTCSGWALFDISTGSLKGVGKLKGAAPTVALNERLSLLQSQVLKIFNQLNLSSDDVLICEAPTTMRDPKAAIKVEQVRGIFEVVARHIGIKVPGRINPRTVQYEIMGLKGKQLSRPIVKDIAAKTVAALYQDELIKLGLISSDNCELRRHQDIVDAVLLGRLGVIKIKSAVMIGDDLENIFSGEIKRRKRSAWKEFVDISN